MTKILVVGAGPTGLTVAVELARRGIIPKVVDEKPEPSSLSRAVGILPRSLEILESSGVSERLLGEGVQIQTLQFYLGDQPWTQVSLRGGHPHYPFLVALAQDRTEAALRDAFVAMGGEVEYGVKFLGLEQTEGQVLAQLSGDRVETCDCLFGADGTRSAVREAINVPFEGYELNSPWSIADVDANDWPHPDRFTISIMPNGDVAVVAPLEEDRYRLESAFQNLPWRQSDAVFQVD